MAVKGGLENEVYLGEQSEDIFPLRFSFRFLNTLWLCQTGVFWSRFPELPECKADNQEMEPSNTGIPVDGDFSKLPRVRNQIPIEQFWKFCDQFFKNISEEDFKWLDDRGDNIEAFKIPHLREHFHPTTDATMEIDLQPLAKRIMSALIHDNLIDVNMLDITKSNDPFGQFDTKLDTMIEDRTKIELFRLGMLNPDLVNDTGSIVPIFTPEVDYHPGDDEVSKELIRLQDQLLTQIENVHAMKQIVKKHAIGWMAWQEWSTIKEMLDKWIEQLYNKMNTKKKRFKSTPQLPPIPPFFLQTEEPNSIEKTFEKLIQRRRHWIDVVGKAIVASCLPANIPTPVSAQLFDPNDPGKKVLTAPTHAQVASHDNVNVTPAIPGSPTS
jgi:hypothetical protein